MVRYALKQYNGNTARVFATGLSSGAMLSQVLAGSYPDVFAGISSFAGVPFACFAGAGMWNNACANGQSIKTAQQWGDLVRAAYPGYTGPRPKVQLWHGTNDETLNYNNFGESVKQWTNVLGLSETPTATQSNSPVSGWTRRTFGPNMQAISAQGVSHNIPLQEAEVIKFFGLDQAAPVVPTTSTPGATPAPTTTTAPPPVTTTAPPANAVAKWGQCGGIGHTGGTVCVSGSTCVKLNDYYSQVCALVEGVRVDADGFAVPVDALGCGGARSGRVNSKNMSKAVHSKRSGNIVM